MVSRLWMAGQFDYLSDTGAWQIWKRCCLDDKSGGYPTLVSMTLLEYDTWIPHMHMGRLDASKA